MAQPRAVPGRMVGGRFVVSLPQPEKPPEPAPVVPEPVAPADVPPPPPAEPDRLTNAEKVHVVFECLRAHPSWSNRAIAAHCGVSHTHVANMRRASSEATASAGMGA